MKNSTIVFFLLLIFCSCRFSTYVENDPKDIAEGEKYLTRFYSTISSGNIDQINQMASDTFKMRLGKSLLGKISETVRTKIGAYQRYTISDRYTRRISSGVTTVYYRYRLKVSYQRAAIDEIVGLQKEPDDSIKVIAYNVYSDLLIK